MQYVCTLINNHTPQIQLNETKTCIHNMHRTPSCRTTPPHMDVIGVTEPIYM